MKNLFPKCLLAVIFLLGHHQNAAAKSNLQGDEKAPLNILSAETTKADFLKIQSEARKEIDATRNYLRNDVRYTMAKIHAELNSVMKLMGVDREQFADNVVNTRGHEGALKTFAEIRRMFLHYEYKQEKTYLQYHLHKTIGNAARDFVPGSTEFNGSSLYNRTIQQVDDKYFDKMDKLENSMFIAAALKVVNEKLETGIYPENMSLYTVGRDVNRLLGKDAGEDVSDTADRQFGEKYPYERASRELIGGLALKIAQMNAFANNDAILVRRFEKNVGGLTQFYKFVRVVLFEF